MPPHAIQPWRGPDELTSSKHAPVLLGLALPLPAMKRQCSVGAGPASALQRSFDWPLLELLVLERIVFEDALPSRTLQEVAVRTL
jgi:hypothetical protein